MVGAVVIFLMSLPFLVLGFQLWKKKKIFLLHSYHYDKVSEDDKQRFCALSGCGVVTIGFGMLLSAVIIAITNSAWSLLTFAAGFAAGLGLLIYAGRKYNR